MEPTAHHFAVTVSDLDRAVAFYRDVLGLDVLSRFSVGGEAFETGVGIDGASAEPLVRELDAFIEAVITDSEPVVSGRDGLRALELVSAIEDQVTVAPDHEIEAATAEESSAESFPPKVEVPKSFVREHERLELEAEHLREQLEEHKRYVTKLRTRLDEMDQDEVIHLEDLDEGDEEDASYRIGSFDDEY